MDTAVVAGGSTYAALGSTTRAAPTLGSIALTGPAIGIGRGAGAACAIGGLGGVNEVGGTGATYAIGAIGAIAPIGRPVGGAIGGAIVGAIEGGGVNADGARCTADRHAAIGDICACGRPGVPNPRRLTGAGWIDAAERGANRAAA